MLVHRVCLEFSGLSNENSLDISCFLHGFEFHMMHVVVWVETDDFVSRDLMLKLYKPSLSLNDVVCSVFAKLKNSFGLPNSN